MRLAAFALAVPLANAIPSGGLARSHTSGVMLLEEVLKSADTVPLEGTNYTTTVPGVEDEALPYYGPVLPSPCVDRGPFPCTEAGCPKAELSCYFLAKHLDACELRFSDLWSTPPPSFGHIFESGISTECAASCGRCTDEQLRATVDLHWSDWPAAKLDVGFTEIGSGSF